MLEATSDENTDGRLQHKERFQILLAEMNSLQSRFDKYDSLIFQNRFWMVTIIIAVLGFAFDKHQVNLVYLAAGIILFFYSVETMWRWRYMHKYIIRYKYIRDSINSGRVIDTFYDLTHDYYQSVHRSDRQIQNGHILRDCFLKPELGVFYGGLQILTGATTMLGTWVPPSRGYWGCILLGLGGLTVIILSVIIPLLEQE